MRRFLLTHLTLCLLALPISAGGPWRGLWKKSASPATSTTASLGGLSSWQISRQLQKRAAASFKQAKQAQEALGSRSLAFGEPARMVLRAKDMPQARVYTDKPFLTTREQTANYLVAQNNRLFLQELKRMQKVWEQIDTHLPQLQDVAAKTPQPANPIAWLAQQIPDQTTLLFVGEIHGYAEIREATAELLGELRQQYPSREILLFTEFLPADFYISTPADLKSLSLPRYAPVWEKALENHIEVIGLEPEFILEDFCYALAINRNGKQMQVPQWGLLEGVRLRNEYWTNTLQKYRAKHPHALFIVHSGSGHSLYNNPFALSAALTQETPFVATLYPDKFLKYSSSSSLIAREPVEAPFAGPLEGLTEQTQFPQPVLQFKDPFLSRVAGFDVRIRFSVDLERYRLEHGY